MLSPSHSTPELVVVSGILFCHQEVFCLTSENHFGRETGTRYKRQRREEEGMWKTEPRPLSLILAEGTLRLLS